MVFSSGQRNLAANFAAELLSMAAFTFVDPLLPLYIQQVGGLATVSGLKSIFALAAGLYILVGLFAARWLPWHRLEKRNT